MGKVSDRQSKKLRRKAQFKKLNRKAILRKGIRKWDDPILSVVCSPVDLSNEEERNSIVALVKRMKEILLACDDGVGLAAPQVGVAKQVIVYRTSLTSKDFVVVINPLLVDGGLLSIKAREGCLSYPGYEAVVERRQIIKVNYKSLNNDDETKTLEGRESIIFQHEADHLLGVCPVGEVWKRSTGRIKDEPIVTDEISSLAFFPKVEEDDEETQEVEDDNGDE
jgi:peptide deformylase